jgi:hypothetical protein
MNRTRLQPDSGAFGERLIRRLRETVAAEVIIDSVKASSRNTVIYRVRANGDPLVCKAELATRPSSVEREYEMLRELQQRLSGAVRSLVPVAVYPELGVLVTREEPGETVRKYIDDAVANPQARGFVEGLMDTCAEALHRFHGAFGISRERGIEHACNYIDFHPGNLLLTCKEQRTLVMMDPPPKEPPRPVHFDIGMFCFGIARAGFTPWALGRFPQRWLDQLKADFVAAYFRRLDRPVSPGDLLRIHAAERHRARRAVLRYSQFFRYRNWPRELARLAWFAPIIGVYVAFHLPTSYRRVARAHPVPMAAAEGAKRG